MLSKGNPLLQYLAGAFDEDPERPCAAPGGPAPPPVGLSLPPRVRAPRSASKRSVARPLVTTKMRLLAWTVLNGSEGEPSENARALAEAVLGDDLTILDEASS